MQGDKTERSDEQPNGTSDPAKGSSDPGDPGSDPAGATPPSPGQAAVAPCRVVATHFFDPYVPPWHWVVPDPDGCVRHKVERLLNRPPLG